MAQKHAETKSRVAALREKVQDEDTIKEQEKVLKTELANAEKEEASRIISKYIVTVKIIVILVVWIV